VQELKAMAHQLWDQGDMLDEMRQWMRLFKANQYVFNLYVFVFIWHIKLMQSFVHQ